MIVIERKVKVFTFIPFPFHLISRSPMSMHSVKTGITLKFSYLFFVSICVCGLVINTIMKNNFLFCKQKHCNKNKKNKFNKFETPKEMVV